VRPASPRLLAVSLAAFLPLVAWAAEGPDDDPYDDPYDDLEAPPLIVPVTPDEPAPLDVIEPQPLPEPVAPAPAPPPEERAAPRAAVDPQPSPHPEPVVSDNIRRVWQVTAGVGGSLALTLSAGILSEFMLARGTGGDGVVMAQFLVLSSYVGGAVLGVQLVGQSLTREPRVPWGATVRGASLGALIGATAGFTILLVPAVGCVVGSTSCDGLFIAVPFAAAVGFLGPALGALHGFEQSLSRLQGRQRGERR
jgi:hypothetical protein